MSFPDYNINYENATEEQAARAAGALVAMEIASAAMELSLITFETALRAGSDDAIEAAAEAAFETFAAYLDAVEYSHDVAADIEVEQGQDRANEAA